ncbi:TRAP transporter large permease [Microbacterium album]|uniref:TRAP transporter large permease n=1 Tax=Microbacterium album TaxID=2053191 RepID=UPI001E64EF0D|nr:TRAP transporter large permease [Microbacterium album]
MILIAAASVVIVLVQLFVPLERQTIGVLAMVLSLLLLLLNVHVSIAFAVAGLVGLWPLGGWRAVQTTAESTVFASAASWQLSVIPMFILMGVILWKGGLTAAAFEAARIWFGRLPGGLAIATTVAGGGLAASSGSTIGIVQSLSRMAIPEMLRHGYSPAMASGAVAASGLLGQIIPPSVILVVYAGVMQTPVGPQLIAGVVPGLLILTAFIAMILVRAAVSPRSVPSHRDLRATWSDRLRALPAALPLVIVVVVVIGGLTSGAFTATESGAFGVVAAVVASIWTQRRERHGARWWLSFLAESTFIAIRNAAAIFILMAGVHFLTRVVALSQLAQGLADSITHLGLSRLSLLLILMLVFLFLGLFMDPLAMMLLTLPVLIVPLDVAGVDPIWFGIFIVLMAEIGMITPPIGILSFIIHRIASDPAINHGRDTTIFDVYRGVTPYVLVSLGAVLLLIFFPEIATWLPTWAGQH